MTFGIGVALATNAVAVDSPWTEVYGAKIRLVAVGGPPGAEGYHAAGIEVRLDEGWKTYWRYPGDSGVPPLFSFAKSDNVENVKVRFPAPHRFVEGGVASIGYKDGVIFPVAVKPLDPARPVRLNLEADLGICEDICVPVSAIAELDLVPDDPPDAAIGLMIETAGRQVPKPAGAGRLALIAVDLDDGPSPPVVTAKLRLSDKDAEHDLFVEGPAEDWFLPLPEPAGRDGDIATYRFELDGLPPGASAKAAELRFTAINGKDAVEQNWRLP
ncbi:MAG: hypothetical protein KDJ16_06040 [Hyphomicrobiales bacterium]|nr:hypothetical protein [Hyphomicrobiales bacterium]